MILLPRLMNPSIEVVHVGDKRPHRVEARGEAKARIACRDYIQTAAQRAGLYDLDWKTLANHPEPKAAGVTADALQALHVGALNAFIDVLVNTYWPKFDTAIAEATVIAETAKREADSDAGWQELNRIITEEVERVVHERAHALMP